MGCCNCVRSTVLRVASITSSEVRAVVEIMTQAIIIFNANITGQIHKMKRLNFIFFISWIDATSIRDRFFRRQHLHIPQIPSKGGLLARKPCSRATELDSASIYCAGSWHPRVSIYPIFFNRSDLDPPRSRSRKVGKSLMGRTPIWVMTHHSGGHQGHDQI